MSSAATQTYNLGSKLLGSQTNPDIEDKERSGGNQQYITIESLDIEKLKTTSDLLSAKHLIINKAGLALSILSMVVLAILNLHFLSLLILPVALGFISMLATIYADRKYNL